MHLARHSTEKVQVRKVEKLQCLNMQKILVVALSSLFLVLRVCCYQPTVRQTANGLVEGIEQTSSLGQKYYAFRGVPYAEVPITGRDPYTGEPVDRRFKV